MARLPTREALGPLPLRRGSGRIASARDLRPAGDAAAATAMGQGFQAFSRGVAKIGEAADAIQEHQDRQALYETERRFQEFEWNQKLALDKSMREVKPDEVGGFADRSVAGYGKSAADFLATVPDKFKQVYDTKLFGVERSTYGSARTFERTEQKRASIASIDEQMQKVWMPQASSSSADDLLKVQGDFEKLVSVNPHLTPIERAEIVKKGKDQLAVSQLYGLIERDPLAAEGVLADKNHPAVRAMSPQQQYALHNSIRTKNEAAESKAMTEHAEEVERSILDGSNPLTGKPLPPRADIENDLGVTTAQRNALLRQHDAATKGVQAFEAFRAKFNGDGAFNPFNKADRDGTDMMFQALGGDMTALKTVVDRTNMVPQAAATSMRGSLVSGDQKRVAETLQVGSNLLTRNPTILSGVNGSSEIEEAVTTFNHRVRDLGMTAEQAAQEHIKSLTPEYQANVKARIKSEDLNEIVKKQLSVDDVRAHFDTIEQTGWWALLPGKPQVGFDPDQRKAMYGDYEELFREYYVKNGNVNESKALALKQLGRIWGVSQVSGSSVVMRYPPDRAAAYHGIDNAADMIADDAISAIREQTGKTVKREQLVFWPSAEFRTSEDFWSGRPPSYVLSWKDDNGNVQTFLKPFYGDADAMRKAQREQKKAAGDEKREKYLKFQTEVQDWQSDPTNAVIPMRPRL